MAIPLLIPLLSGGMKAVGGMAERKKASEERKRITRWSPWTGIEPPKRQEGNAINDLLQGAGAGIKVAKDLGKMASAVAPTPPTPAIGGGGGGSTWKNLALGDRPEAQNKRIPWMI